jgi:hypothetical protein
MAYSVRNIIDELNQALNAVFNGSKFYGAATSVETNGRLQPSVNEFAVAFDDSYSMQVYHKINSVQITSRAGFGDIEATRNTYNLSAYIFNNEQKTKLKQEEVAMIIQSVFSSIKILSVRIVPVNVILNSAGIFAAEYRGYEYPLSEYFSLMQFNYNVEITFKSGCFDLCPEDFHNCKIN